MQNSLMREREELGGHKPWGDSETPSTALHQDTIVWTRSFPQILAVCHEKVFSGPKSISEHQPGQRSSLWIGTSILTFFSFLMFLLKNCSTVVPWTYNSLYILKE